MSALLILDVPENVAVVETAIASGNVRTERIGPYIALISDRDITIDRRTTGCRHAVWYSCIAGTLHSRITQWDSNALVAVVR
ncbi:hypothetical protein AADR41_01910 [Streptomyces sp. CLV115]|uniref:hypothetical protein n=1 Tax=Streptomyces sp. CLV115 TaxID=3138502 RepID=UPI00313B63D3